MHFYQPTDSQPTLATVDRLCRHHDYLKALVREYALMRQEQTDDRMADPTFRTDCAAMDLVDSPGWLRTSLIVKLPEQSLQPFFADVNQAYSQVKRLIHHYYPTCEVDIYSASAHITLKTICGDVSQSADDLAPYLAIIQPIVARWLPVMADTKLYAVGLFSSLSAERGLSLGLRFYPSLPLLQIIRGEVGVALYTQNGDLPLRPETSFHTILTHSTGCRARLSEFPLNPNFVNELQTLIEQYDRHLFGVLNGLTPADLVIRHGYSDQLVPLVEVSCIGRSVDR